MAGKPIAIVAPPKKRGVDYSKFDALVDSDDERPVLSQESNTIPIGVPKEAVTRIEFDRVFHNLLKMKDIPYTPAPDLDAIWGYYQRGGMDEQALLDQAGELLGHLPLRLDAADWKSKTYGLTRKMEAEGRVDEARLWSMIHMGRFPTDGDAFYNQGVLLGKMCDMLKFSGAPTARLFSVDGSAPKEVPAAQYCSLFSKAAASQYRRCIRLDPKARAGYINLIGCLERSEPQGWYDEVHEIAAVAVRNGIWYNKWQRSPHYIPALEAKPWHDPQDFSLCCALRDSFSIIRDEYDAYISRLASRKDWDDRDTTPGFGDVGGREGALHDGGLAKSGRWREVPLFAGGALKREYAEFFPETVRILQEKCADATGLALCFGGDVIFSVLSPGTRLRAHCGPSNARLTCHLAIHVPRTLEQGCRLRVAGDPPRGWTEGECLLFDDSFEHDVVFEEAGPHEPAFGERVVLLANFWHPSFKFKNDPRWRERSDELMATVDVESLPQTQVVKHASA